MHKAFWKLVEGELVETLNVSVKNYDLKDTCSNRRSGLHSLRYALSLVARLLVIRETPLIAFLAILLWSIKEYCLSIMKLLLFSIPTNVRLNWRIVLSKSSRQVVSHIKLDTIRIYWIQEWTLDFYIVKDCRQAFVWF